MIYQFISATLLSRPCSLRPIVGDSHFTHVGVNAIKLGTNRLSMLTFKYMYAHGHTHTRAHRHRHKKQLLSDGLNNSNL